MLGHYCSTLALGALWLLATTELRAAEYGASAEPVVTAPDTAHPSGAAAEVTAQRRDLLRGLAALEAQDIEQARQALEAALAAGPYTLAEVQQLYRGLGVIRAYYDDQTGARWAFERLLAIAPQSMLAYTTSPKATFLFQEVKEALRSQPSLQLELELPSVAPLGVPIEVSCRRVSDVHELVRQVEVLYRTKGQTRFERLRIAAPALGEQLHIELPAVAEAAAQPDPDGTLNAILELALIGYDENGWEVFYGPAPAAPRELPVGFDAPGPWYTQWWLWGLIGSGVAVAGASVVALALQPESVQVPFWYRVEFK